MQINKNPKELEGINFSPLSSCINNFQDTANIVSSLDLVISVDTSTVHLCGAMNKECWLLLPKVNTDWRWIKKSSTQYKSIRIFMQRKYNSWGEVIDEVSSELIKLII